MDEPPTRDCTIVDVTCDSDGKIDRFIEGDGVDETLSLHPLRPGEPYYLGMFLTGAYQDILADMHNLFGRVNELHVFADDEDPEDFYIEEYIPGETIAKVLSRVQYEPSDLFRRVKNELDQRIKDGTIRPKDGVSLADFYESVMKGYTYLWLKSKAAPARPPGGPPESHPNPKRRESRTRPSRLYTGRSRPWGPALPAWRWAPAPGRRQRVRLQEDRDCRDVEGQLRRGRQGGGGRGRQVAAPHGAGSRSSSSAAASRTAR